MKTQKLTKTTCVLEDLRNDIINGTFAPGEKLQMDHLKERYGVGYCPLREALSRLAENGLVTFKEQCGFYVTALSLNELHDLYNIRIHIESLALELSICHGDDQWEADILASWHLYEKYLNPKTNNNFAPEQWDLLQKNFLYSLVKACQSPWLLKIRTTLYDQAQRYRALCLSTHYQNKKFLLQCIKENNDLVSAVLARDVKKAVQLSQQSWKESVKVAAAALKKILDK